MAITRKDPRTIHLGGPIVRVNDLPATSITTPGMLLERAAGKYALHTAAAVGPMTLALNAPELNKGVDDDYAADDLIWAGVLPAGSTGLAWLASGQNVSDGDTLESDGLGLLTALSSGVALCRAIEDKDASAADARIRVEAI